MTPTPHTPEAPVLERPPAPEVPSSRTLPPAQPLAPAPTPLVPRLSHASQPDYSPRATKRTMVGVALVILVGFLALAAIYATDLLPNMSLGVAIGGGLLLALGALIAMIAINFAVDFLVEHIGRLVSTFLRWLHR